MARIRGIVAGFHAISGSGTLLAAAAALSLACAGSAGAAEVHILPYEGAITPVASEFLISGIEEAEDAGAAAVIIQLDTPGGLDTAMRDIIKAEFASAVPVVVFVGPSGSRAASAGAFLTIAAHIAAMAPGTNIGSASPVSIGGGFGGGGADTTMAKKVSNDAAAYMTSLADRRGRNAEVARAFVTEARNLTAEEALAQNLIDFVAPTLSAVLDSLQGLVVVTNDGEQIVDVAGAVLVEKTMSARQKLLKQLANPNLAYILMLLGIYGLFFELSNPGALVPGILGGICLLLALFAFQALPVNYAGVGLILLGVILLILEVKVTSFGGLTIGGLAALVLGSLMLFDSGEPWARVSLRVLIPAVMVFAGFFIVCVWLAVRGHKKPVITGKSALAGEQGRVVAAIGGGEATGKVVFHGEIWDATSDEPVPEGNEVQVIAVDGRVARVRSI
jgi:membrane-bound serine protease (ClpP class)